MTLRLGRLIESVPYLILAGLVCLTAFTVTVATSPKLQAKLTAVEGGYSTGQRIDIPEPFFKHSKRTVIVFARASCAACENARPFLNALSSAVNQIKGARMVLVMPLPTPGETAYAAQIGVDEAAVCRIAGNQVRVAVVPTIVDDTGRITFVRQGLPETADEPAILRQLTSTP